SCSAVRPQPGATLFPYTTLFRSEDDAGDAPRGGVHLRSRERRLAGRTARALRDLCGLARPVRRGGADERRRRRAGRDRLVMTTLDRKSTRLNSSHVKISYAVFCL